jgi:hypothetical protein
MVTNVVKVWMSDDFAQGGAHRRSGGPMGGSKSLMVSMFDILNRIFSRSKRIKSDFYMSYAPFKLRLQDRGQEEACQVLFTHFLLHFYGSVGHE